MVIEGISITDVKRIMAAIKEVHNFDFSNYALSSFKRRVSNLINSHNLKSVDELIEKIKSDKSYFDFFLRDISVSVTEMFRDPLLWKELKEKIIPKIISQNSRPKIWIPEFTTGEDLYSLAIILKELKALDTVQVIASSCCKKNIELLNDTFYEAKKMDVNIANYSKYNLDASLSQYYTMVNNKIMMDISLLSKFEIIRLNIFENVNPSKVHLILYRNRLIYFNQVLQDEVISILNHSLVTGYYLILGSKELIGNGVNEKFFKIVNETEKIYKKANS